MILTLEQDLNFSGHAFLADTCMNIEGVETHVASSTPNWVVIVQAVSSAVSALAAIFLVYVAVRFREEVRAARKRPELTLHHDSAVDATLFRDPHWNYDLYLRVQNKPGQDRALHVGLELVNVRPLGDTPQLHTRPPRRSFAVAEMRDYGATEVDLPPNVARRFLVVFHDVESSGPFAELAVLPRAKTGRDKLPPGEYELTVALTASNTDATYWTTKVVFQGIASSEEHDTSRLMISAPQQVESGG